MLHIFVKYIVEEFIEKEWDEDKRKREQVMKLSNIEIYNMEYIENYICEYSYYYYQIGRNKTHLTIFFHNLSYHININIEKKNMKNG